MNSMNDNRSYTGLVDKYIGTAYDMVAEVAEAIRNGWLTPNNLQVIATASEFINYNQGSTLDKAKPYFTRGHLKINDGGAGYYVYIPTMPRDMADGEAIIDPTVHMIDQGSGTEHGCWVRQTAGNDEVGPIGPQGPAGIQGVQGASGLPGVQGIQGNPGDMGHTGDQGVQGVQGAPGHKGIGIHIKGVVATYSELLLVLDPEPGDAYVVSSTGDLWISDPQQIREYSGSDWHYVGHVQGPPGHVGPEGLQGIQGPPGIEGHQGPDGMQGVAGPQGQQGLTGGNGPQGIAGPPGSDGTGVTVKGIATTQDILAKTGVAGDFWISSDNGHGYFYTGVAGRWQDAGPIRGPAGYPGPIGATGVHGAAGPPGLQGIQGSLGPIGIAGPAGPQGIQGIRGVPGHTGAGILIRGAFPDTNALLDLLKIQPSTLQKGHAYVVNTWRTDVADALRQFEQEDMLWVYDDSYPGDLLDTAGAPTPWHRIGHIRGPAGHPGADGTQGVQGIQGERGPQGAQGLPSTVPGPAGATGPRGPQGQQGVQGIKGATGGTGGRGLTGLTGPKGATGAASTVRGPAGATGARGTPGGTGARGSAGAKGATGATGARAVVRGGTANPTGGASGDLYIQY